MKQGSSSMNVLGAIYSWMKERNMGSKVKWRSKSSKVGHKQTLHKDRLEILGPITNVCGNHFFLFSAWYTYQGMIQHILSANIDFHKL